MFLSHDSVFVFRSIVQAISFHREMLILNDLPTENTLPDQITKRTIFNIDFKTLFLTYLYNGWSITLSWQTNEWRYLVLCEKSRSNDYTVIQEWTSCTYIGLLLSFMQIASNFHWTAREICNIFSFSTLLQPLFDVRCQFWVMHQVIQWFNRIYQSTVYRNSGEIRRRPESSNFIIVDKDCLLYWVSIVLLNELRFFFAEADAYKYGKVNCKPLDGYGYVFVHIIIEAF